MTGNQAIAVLSAATAALAVFGQLEVALFLLLAVLLVLGVKAVDAIERRDTLRRARREAPRYWPDGGRR